MTVAVRNVSGFSDPSSVKFYSKEIMNPQIPVTPSSPEGAGAGGASMETSGKLTQAKQSITQTARDAASKVKTAAADTATRARTEAERIAEEKKENAANRIGGYGSAIHESAQSLEEQDPNIAWFTHRAANRLQSFADYVRDRDFAGLREDCGAIARRHPAAFFGGMFLAGIVAGNLVKASQRTEDSGSMEDADTDWRRYNEELPPEPNLQDELPMSSSPSPAASGI